MTWSSRRASGSERVDELSASLKGKIFVKLPKDLNSEGFQLGEIRELLKLIYAINFMVQFKCEGLARFHNISSSGIQKWTREKIFEKIFPEKEGPMCLLSRHWNT